MLNWTIEVASINPPPVNLKMCDSINCPICGINLSEELGIDLQTFVVNNDTSIYCEGCDMTVKFKIVKI